MPTLIGASRQTLDTYQLLRILTGMHTISAYSNNQIAVSFDNEVVNRVALRGTVHLTVEGDLVVLKGKPWEMYIRREDSFEDASRSGRDKLIERAIQLGTEWVKAHKIDLLKAEVESKRNDLDRARRNMLELKAQYDAACEASAQAAVAYEHAKARLAMGAAK